MAAPSATTSTRQQILSVATDLFIEQGYEATSLRQIADRIGVTKAALYYHFASKSDLVRAMLEPLDELQLRFLDGLSADPSPEEWADMLSLIIDWMIDNQRLFMLIERNHEVFEHLHQVDNVHLELHTRLDEFVSRPGRDPVESVRMASALGVAVSMAGFGASLLDTVPSDVIKVELNQNVRRVLGLRPRRAARSSSSRE